MLIVFACAIMTSTARDSFFLKIFFFKSTAWVEQNDFNRSRKFSLNNMLLEHLVVF